jgi:hypothetical protein
VTEEFDSGQALLLEAFVAARREPEVAVMLRRVIEHRTENLVALITEAQRTGGIDPELDTLSIVRFCHAVALGFLLFGAIDLARPQPRPWEELIHRLVEAVAEPSPDPAGDSTTSAPSAADAPAAEDS